MENNINFEEMKHELLHRLNEKGYSKTYIDDSYVIDLRKLKQFLANNNTNSYTARLGKEFIKITSQEKVGSNRKNSYKRTIRHLNEILNGKSFQSIEPCKKSLRIFNDALTLFELDQTKNGLRERTISDRKRGAYYFLSYLESEGISELAMIRPEIIYAAFSKTQGKRLFSSVIPIFFKFLYKAGFVEQDFSKIVPKTVIPKPIPAVYTEEEISDVLGSINRNTCQGKRDYAIFLLQARYGIRNCDIVKLKFDNVNFAGKRISFVQSKTLVPISFPMDESVFEALWLYINKARPPAHSELIFLSTNAPHTPMTGSGCSTVVKRCFRKSGVERRGREQGGHALRSSLASNLVNSDIAYTFVQKILGHSTIATVQDYAKIDIERLRLCALDVPPPSNMLKAFLECEKSEIT